MKHFTLKKKILTLLVGIIGGFVFMVFYIVTYLGSQEAETRIQADLAKAGGAFDEFQEMRAREVRLVASMSYLRALVMSRDKPTIEQFAKSLQMKIDNDLLIITDDRGEVLAWTDEGEKQDSLRSYPFIQESLKGQETRGVLTVGKKIYQVTAVPIGLGQRSFGIINVAYLISERFLNGLKAMAQVDVSFVQEGRLIASTLDGVAKSQLEGKVRQYLGAPTRRNIDIKITGEKFRIKILPFGEGSTYLLQQSWKQAGLLATKINKAFIIGLTLFIPFIIFAFWQVVRMLKPLDAMVMGLEKLAGEISADSNQMQENSKETNKRAHEVSAASEKTDQNIHSVASATQEMTDTTKEISKNVHEAARITSQAVEVANSTNAKIKRLGDSSAEIGEVIKVITSIAEQTNMLALNATIEAARAGEAGRGFAVVANEVKELAKQTAKATEEISQKIGTIQGETNGAVDAMGEIGQIINQINEISTTIAGAVEEQSATTGEISRNMGEAAKGARRVSEDITEVSKASKSVMETADHMLEASQSISIMGEKLIAIVGKSTLDSNGSGKNVGRKQGITTPPQEDP